MGGRGEGGPFRWVTLPKMKARDQENMAVPGQKVAFPGSLPGMCGQDRDPLPMVPGPVCLLFNKSSICLVDPNALPSQGPRQHLRCINKARAVGYRIRLLLALLSLAEQFPPVIVISYNQIWRVAGMLIPSAAACPSVDTGKPSPCLPSLHRGLDSPRLCFREAVPR